MHRGSWQKSTWARFTGFGVMRFNRTRRSWVRVGVYPIAKARLAFAVCDRVGGRLVPLEWR